MIFFTLMAFNEKLIEANRNNITLKRMHTFFLLCLAFLSTINFVESSQCAKSDRLAGYCGCCPIIGGSCVYLETIDMMDVSWHLCVPDHVRANFSLSLCKPKILFDKNSTRLCRTRYGTFRLFPQCAMKDVCSIPLPGPTSLSRIKILINRLKSFLHLDTRLCRAATAVYGSCKESFRRFSYNATLNQCVPFVYSGCGGTPNRFIHKDRCEKLCQKTNLETRRTEKKSSSGEGNGQINTN